MDKNKLGEDYIPPDNQYITEVLIRGNKYELWQLNDREPHDTGTLNGESGLLWVKESSDYDNLFGEFEEKKDWIPWLDGSGNRDCWEIHIKDGNSMKFTHTNYRIDKHTSANISINGKHVYEISGREFDWCYNKARSIIYELKGLIYVIGINLKDTNKEIGRKIYYKGLPSTIKQIYINGTMDITPDYTDIEKDTWWNEIVEPWYDDYAIEDLDLCKKRNGIVIDILSDNIHWTRNDRTVKLNKIKRNVSGKGTS